MTVQYQGNDVYKVFIGEQELLLSQDEVNEIQCWDFVNRKDISDEVEELEDELEKTQTSTSELYQKLAEVISEIDKIGFTDKENFEAMKAIREKISVISQKLGEI